MVTSFVLGTDATQTATPALTRALHALHFQVSCAVAALLCTVG